MLVLFSALWEHLSVWGHDQTADFKWHKTANFEIEKKYDELEKERNEQFCIREQLAGKLFLQERNI